MPIEHINIGLKKSQYSNIGASRFKYILCSKYMELWGSQGSKMLPIPIGLLWLGSVTWKSRYARKRVEK